MDRGVFWITITLVIAIGTVGNLLFKYGLDSLEDLDFAKLFEVRLSFGQLPYAAMALVGVSFFLYAATRLSSVFLLRIMLTPTVFASFLLMLAARVFSVLPLSVTGLGRLTSILTTLSILATAVCSATLLGERFDTRTVVGISLGLISILLMGET